MQAFECKRCQNIINAEDQYVGEVVECPNCSGAEIVPDPSFTKGTIHAGYVIESIYESDVLWTAYRVKKSDDPQKNPYLLKIPTQFFIKHVTDFNAFADTVVRTGTIHTLHFPQLIDRSIVHSNSFFAYDYIPTTHGLRFFTKIDFPDALELMRGIAIALKDAWDKNLIVHQNLTPKNIRITKDQQVRIHNMGISSVLLQDHNLLDWGFNIWDHRYMSPEFIQQGIADTPACDIYSLGGLLFFLLTGHHPYERINPADIPRVPIPNPMDYNNLIPPEILSLFNVMMAKDLDNRLKTWDQVIENLNLILGVNRKSANQTQFVARYQKTDSSTNPRAEENFVKSASSKKVFHKHKKKEETTPQPKATKRLVFNKDTKSMKKVEKVHKKWKKK